MKEKVETTLAAVERQIYKDAKVFCVQQEVKLVEFVTNAIKEKLERDSKKKKA